MQLSPRVYKAMHEILARSDLILYYHSFLFSLFHLISLCISLCFKLFIFSDYINLTSWAPLISHLLSLISLFSSLIIVGSTLRLRNIACASSWNPSTYHLYLFIFLLCLNFENCEIKLSLIVTVSFFNVSFEFLLLLTVFLLL